MRAAVPMLVGRGAELAALEGCLDAARAGDPQVVLVEGEPGLGKSALVEAFLYAHPDVEVIGSVRCDAFEQQLAFGVAGLLLGRWLTGTSEVEVGRELLAWLGDAQSDDQTLVLVIDDAQWLDRSSAQAIRMALRRLRVDRVLTIVARRPPTAEDLWQGFSGRQGPAPVLRLSALTAPEVQQLAGTASFSPLPLSTAERLVARTGGLPLLVESLLRDAHTTDDLDSDRVPASAAAAARRMLASVDEPARLLVEAASVLAEATPLPALGSVAGVADPSAAATTARAAGLLTAGPTGRLDCSHALLRDAVYQEIPLDRRRQLHRRAVDWTGADRRLSHRVAAADQADPQLLTDLLVAVDQAESLGRRQLAGERRLQARDLSTDPQQRDVLLLQALMDRVGSQDLTGAGQLATAAHRAGPGALRSLALGLLARETGRVAEARSLLGQARAQATADQDDDLAADAATALAELCVALNDGPEATAAARAALTASDPAVAGDAITLYGLGRWQSGDLSGALQTLDAVRTSPEGRPWEVDLLAARGMVRHYAGQLDGALDDLDAALALTHLWRPGSNQPRTYVQRSMTRYTVGDWDGATVDAAAARAVAEGLGQPWSRPLADAISAQVPAGRGQWDLAAEHLGRAREGMSQAPSTQVRGILVAVQVLLATARQDWAEVAATLASLQSGETLRRLALVRSFRWVFTGWIRASTELGELAEATTALGRYEDLLREWPEGPTPTRLGLLRGGLAEARGDAVAAQRHYVEDLADPLVLGQPFVHAQALHVAGNLERVLGNRRGAIDRFQHAQRLFTALRATPYLDRCTADLAACGLRGGGADPLTLTEREEDVVALVARGHTNKEVAAELFLTAKTIEYHLRNVYTKLGITSRRELRQLRAG